PDRFPWTSCARGGLPGGAPRRRGRFDRRIAGGRCGRPRPRHPAHCCRSACMSGFLGSVWWMIVSLGLLVTFHEFGHYWVARRCGVRVLRFSVGFGKPLWSRKGRDGTEYVIAALPLGGYVRML